MGDCRVFTVFVFVGASSGENHMSHTSWSPVRQRSSDRHNESHSLSNHLHSSCRQVASVCTRRRSESSTALYILLRRGGGGVESFICNSVVITDGTFLKCRPHNLQISLSYSDYIESVLSGLMKFCSNTGDGSLSTVVLVGLDCQR